MDIAIENIKWFDRNGDRVRLSVAGGVITARPWKRSFKDYVLMAAGKSNYFISKFLNQLFNGTAYTFPTTLYFALWTSALTASSTGSSSGEASYTSYARVAVTVNTTNFSTSASGSSVTNNTAITFPTSTAGSAQTMTYAAILDASTTGNIIFWGSITSTTVNPGDTPQININAFTAMEA